jgi:mannose-1-phosphate guanylyltransferase
MVLAAGLGTRLRPLTEELAKPLVPVGDRPALAHVLDRLATAGLARVVVNAHHTPEPMRRFVRERAGVALSHERELLGTAGGVANAAPLLGTGDVLVWNADILAEVDPAALLAAHAADPPRQATLVVQPRAIGQGSVGLDGAGRIVRLRSERVAGEERGGEFLGIHVLGEGLRSRLPARGCLVGDVYIPAMRAGARLMAFHWNEDAPFFDIGTLASYLDANLTWLAVRGLASWGAPGSQAPARVAAGVTLDRVVLGEGASVAGEGAFERCVVWPGATARAPLAGAVVTPTRVVPAAPMLSSSP